MFMKLEEQSSCRYVPPYKLPSHVELPVQFITVIPRGSRVVVYLIKRLSSGGLLLFPFPPR